MNIDEHYSRVLAAMDEDAQNSEPAQWESIGDLTRQALRLLDTAGLSHHAAARALSAAMDAVELELHNSDEEFLPLAPEPDLG